MLGIKDPEECSYWNAITDSKDDKYPLTTVLPVWFQIINLQKYENMLYYISAEAEDNQHKQVCELEIENISSNVFIL